MATVIDFCEIFRREMGTLYHLALLLAGDPVIAEKCFVAGLENCLEGTPVFREWASRWSRHIIIKNAIHARAPIPGQSNGISPETKSAVAPPKGLEAVASLNPFERFVFVICVLERYSDSECASLLGSSVREVASAKSRALLQVAAAKGKPAGAERTQEQNKQEELMSV
jgi:DNA-directed RNA polymerase specialized sigma24 family protein